MKDGKGTQVSRRNFLKLSGITAARAAGGGGRGRGGAPPRPGGGVGEVVQKVG
jgi:hypothetical protein